MSTPARLIDLTLAGAQYKVMKGALDVLTTAPEFDLVVVVVGSSARFYPDLAVKPIIDSAGVAKADRGIPGAGGAGRAGAAGRCGRAEFPHAGGLRRCGGGGAAAARAAADRGASGKASGAGRMLDELEAYALLDRLGVPRAPSVAIDANTDTAPALPFPYPVAVKALSAEIAHKSDVGGVVLNVTDDAALLAAIAKIKSATGVDSVLVQPMIGGPRRGADRLSRRRRRRPAGDAGGRRHPRRNPPRPQPPARAGRSRRGPGHDRRGRGAQSARRLSRQARRRSRRAGGRRWLRCRGSRSRTAPPSPRPRSIR